ncbi:MAG TPA: hypothetical protein PLU24_05560 [Candidatus Omnitrophota bacterium]|nr:hypothetical protein [Candidatus Omnitrophota bacterium]
MDSAGTVNLFVKRQVFENIGFFEDSVRSGADMQFTNKAVLSGYKLVFARDAIVFHPTRAFKELIKKSYRVGIGIVDVMTARGIKAHDVILRTLKNFLPPSPFTLSKKLSEKTDNRLNKNFISIISVAYLCKITKGAGMACRIARVSR